MCKYVSLLVILATFFACKTTDISSVSSVSSNTMLEGQLEEEWVLIKEGEDEGKYEGKLWGFTAFRDSINEGDLNFLRYTIKKEYDSEDKAVEVCQELRHKVEKEINPYGPTNLNISINNSSQIIIDNISIESRTICDISVTSQNNPQISATIGVDSSNIVSMTMTLPAE